MKCPDCGEYSLTYDFERNGWWCHVYNGFIPDEHTRVLLVHALAEQLYQKLVEIGVFG